MPARRVVIGDFGAVAGLGLRDILAGEGLEVVGHARERDVPEPGIVPLVNEVRPDVVVLDLDDESALEVAVQITSEFPAIKVVACSSEEPVMQVFPPFHHGESYLSQLTRAHLAQALHN
jgi:DNA-binding NarL/FixJ family response regulator